MIIIRL